MNRETSQHPISVSRISIFGKICLYMLITIAVSQSIAAQPSLEATYNMIRSGDKLIKQTVESTNPGQAGEDIIWDFSRQKITNKEHYLSYIEYQDSIIIGYENRTYYKYRSINDTLYMTGYSTPTQFTSYIAPICHLPFPFSYKDSVSFSLNGIGRYCDRIDLQIHGNETLQADAWGTIILPSNDTLHHALRLHSERRIANRASPHNIISAELPPPIPSDSITIYTEKDSMQTHITTYRWYADGYRYPVFETKESTSYLYGKKIYHHSTAYLYSPDKQAILSEDLDNPARLAATDTKSLQKNRVSQDALSDYHIYQQKNHLIIEYRLNRPADCSFLLFDYTGRTISGRKAIKKPAGINREEIPLDSSITGECLLRFTVNKKVYGEKIIQKP